jgi:bifunctional DNase/RNase
MDTDASDPDAADEFPARIDSVRVAGTPNGVVPVVLVAREGEAGTGPSDGIGADPSAVDDDPPGRVLPIFIGFEEARSIVRGLEAEDIGRPLTHDLTLDIVEELGGRVTRVVVSGLEAGTFFADLHLDTPRDAVTVDARPSDSLALAARTNAPLAIARSVWEEGAEDAAEFADLDHVMEVFEDDD